MGSWHGSAPNYARDWPESGAYLPKSAKRPLARTLGLTWLSGEKTCHAFQATKAYHATPHSSNRVQSGSKQVKYLPSGRGHVVKL